MSDGIEVEQLQHQQIIETKPRKVSCFYGLMCLINTIKIPISHCIQLNTDCKSWVYIKLLKYTNVYVAVQVTCEYILQLWNEIKCIIQVFRIQLIFKCKRQDKREALRALQLINIINIIVFAYVQNA